MCKGIYGYKRNDLTQELDKFQLYPVYGTAASTDNVYVKPEGWLGTGGLGSTQDGLLDSDKAKAKVGCQWRMCPQKNCPEYPAAS
jgi:hypothetical protein